MVGPVLLGLGGLAKIYGLAGADPGFDVGGSQNGILGGFPRAARENEACLYILYWE